VEISRVLPPAGSQAPAIFLLESPEPLSWDRMYHTLRRSAGTPQRRRVVTIDRQTFGAPDAGTTFEYSGHRWTTDVELQVTPDGVTSRVAGPWTIRIETPRATWLQLAVRVAPGGTARLRGEGLGVSADATQDPTTPGTEALLAISAGRLDRAILTGSGTAIVRMVTVERFVPGPPRTPVRLAHVVLPATITDTQHSVEVAALADIDVSGWTIRWFAAAAPGEPALYHAFGSNTVVHDGEVIRVWGSVAAPAPQPGVRVLGGGAVGTVPPEGVVLQLVDTAGQVVHEIAALADAVPTAFGFADVAVSGDATRALLIPALGSYDSGHWGMRLQMVRTAVWGRPVLSVGGDSSPEIAVVQFTTE
jgi:hypothetical protein